MNLLLWWHMLWRLSHLDCCNPLFRSLSNFNMSKLQCIKNTLSVLVTNCNKYIWAYPILKQLDWLPVEFHCIFKMTTLVLHSRHSSYFGSFRPSIVEDISQDITIQIKGSKRSLNSTYLHINKEYSSYSFPFYTPTV